MPTEPSTARTTPTSSKAWTAAAAFWMAGGAFVIAAGLAIAYAWYLQAFDRRVLCTHGGDKAMGFLLVGGPAVLFAGGILSLLLALNWRSKRSPRWRWAITGGVVEIVLSMLLFPFNFIEFANAYGSACGGIGK